MRRIGGLLPGGEVTAGVAAIRGCDLQVVVIVDMAGGARNVGMAVGEQKARGAVIELSAQPAIEAVAGVALGGKLCSHVIGIRGLLERFQMAGIALRG